jgi:hypothetical protein
MNTHDINTRDTQLDQRLRALFGGLDLASGFDARLMARLRAEPPNPTERANQARQHELARHERALSDLRSWRRSMLRLLTLDTLGIGFLLVVAAFN